MQVIARHIDFDNLIPVLCDDQIEGQLQMERSLRDRMSYQHF